MYVILLYFLTSLAKLELQSMGGGLQRIKGTETGLYVAMNSEGNLYSSVSYEFLLTEKTS